MKEEVFDHIVVCPKCGGENILGIMYGLVNTNEVEDYGTSFSCNDCDCEFEFDLFEHSTSCGYKTY
jgi:Zn finger protein HypA/HybF involved in hydrogenase expression